jgi:hypothetical protein
VTGFSRRKTVPFAWGKEKQFVLENQYSRNYPVIAGLYDECGASPV